MIRTKEIDITRNKHSFIPRWKKIVALFLVPLIILVLIEFILLVLATFSIIKFPRYNQPPSWESHAHNFLDGLFKPSLFEADSKLFWRFKPGFNGIEKVNEEGFLGPVNHPRIAREFRIVILGDSSSAFNGANYEEGFGPVLSQMLTNSNIESFILNRSVHGYTSGQGLILLSNRIDELDPDVVIVSYGCNDNDRQRIKPDSYYYEENASLVPSIHYFLSRFQIYRALRAFIDIFHPVIRRKDLAQRVPLNEYEKTIVSIITVVKNKSAKTILLNISSPTHYRESMRRIAEAENIPFVDGEQVLRELYFEINGPVSRMPVPDIENDFDSSMRLVRCGHSVYIDGIHPNALGHKALAEALYPFVKMQLRICSKQ